MTGTITSDIRELLAHPATVATIATLDETGAPYAVPALFLQLDDSGRLVHPELLETSTTHRNLLRSIWFELPVTITLFSLRGRVTIVRGKVHKAHVSGPLFSDHYRELRSRLGDVDLAAVWLIDILEIIDDTFALRRAREEELHPFFKHLDRLAVADRTP
ncbi:hypothetical protein OR1_02559 [Geobacter sp. OR-1]|uniref:pyridoxamine 5'-phosphate oxidase family protein n=1 Tax=Geobacter sp. OR-1 TaxID=1266765 RepID=UPI00054390D0|nr:pyridoxamine 5'-phosphate oxidase family protein [Geobacter sp. OR-1]GAM10271.1 hypothetical protein OR1_02559 [Geobacter sp. OR-1]